MILQSLRLSLFIVVSLLCADFAAAQQATQFKSADTSSPRDTLRSFLEACNELHDLIQERQCVDRNTHPHRELAWRVLDCIDASELPSFARAQRTGEVAAALKEILDRVELPPWNEIPDAVEIQAAGGYEELSRWRIPDTRITIERVEQGPQKHEYLFSTGTVERAIGYFQEIDHRPYRTEGPKTSPGFYKWYISVPGNPFLGSMVQQLPEWMRFGRTLGLANWKWPGVILLLILGIGAMWALYSLKSSVTNRVSPRKRLRYLSTIIFPVAAMMVPLAFRAASERYLTVRGMPLYIISFGSYFVFIVAAIIALFAASTRVAESIIASPKINTYGLNAQLIRISSKLVAILLTAVLLITGGQYLGIPIATLLASAGIGGIAIALGAQDTLKNIFATVALMADKPCRVGDRIVVEEFDGFVEDIGLRSTKVRLLSGPLVTIPNDQLVNRDVQNISEQWNIRRSAQIHVPLDTPCKKVEKAVAMIREILADREGMDPDFPPRVFFDEFGPTAFCIRFVYWYSPPDRWEFKAFGEKLNLEIFRAFEAEGIQFSLPLRHSYWKQDDQQGPLEINLSGNITSAGHDDSSQP